MLKEGWDVRNVTTICGLRAYSAKSNILPEQTLGRGLRKMYAGRVEEYVSVVGTDAFMEFVESIQKEGVELERTSMGEGSKGKTPIIIEVDSNNETKDLAELDIEIPLVSPRLHRDYQNLADLDLSRVPFQSAIYQQFSEEEQREIVFKDITSGEVTHTTVLDVNGIADYRSVLGFFTQTLMKELKLVSGYDTLYGKVKGFVRDELFGEVVDLESPNTIRNLSEMPATKTLLDTFKTAINELTVKDTGSAEIRDKISLRNTRPFVVKDQGYLVPKKSVFNRIIGDLGFELKFASFLEDAADVKSFAKNFLAVNFKLDYVNADGGISNYTPDFIVKDADGTVTIIETKGLEELALPLKMARLKQWCEDVNALQDETVFTFAYVDEQSFRRHSPRSFADIRSSFTEYQ